MSVAFDNADTAAAAGLAASITASFTTTGANILLTVLATQATAQTDISSATWNGVAMTAHTQFTTVGTRNVRFFYLEGAEAGTFDLVVTYADASSRPMVVIASWTGVDSIENLTNADSNSTTMSWTVGSESGDLVGALIKGNAGNTFTWESPANERFQETISTIGEGSVADEAGAASVTINGTKSSAAWGGTAFNMNVVPEDSNVGSVEDDFEVLATVMVKNIVVT